MPSGYTHKIYDGSNTDPRDYVLRAARGLGFLIHMRDDSMDAPLRKRSADSYTEKRLEEYTAKLNWAKTATDEELIEKQNQEIEEAREQARKSERINRERELRYNEVLSRLREWTPTTQGGKRTREFAIEHLLESIKFDTGHDVWRCVPYHQPVGEYRAARISEYARLCDSCVEQAERERKNKEESDAWIDGLLEDLETL